MSPAGSLRLVKRGWILFFLSVMVVSAVEMVTASAGNAEGFVLLFLAAMAGTDATSIAISLNSRGAAKNPVATKGEARMAVLRGDPATAAAQARDQA